MLSEDYYRKRKRIHFGRSKTELNEEAGDLTLIDRYRVKEKRRDVVFSPRALDSDVKKSFLMTTPPLASPTILFQLNRYFTVKLISSVQCASVILSSFFLSMPIRDWQIGIQLCL